MYHPLVVFDGITGFPLGVILRPGNVHASKGAVAILKRVIRKLKKAYPETPILLRADAGFSIPEIYRFCEKERFYYLIGLITNNRLKDKAARLAAQVQRDFEQTGSKQRRFTSFQYKADSWRRSRRVIAKVERLEKGLNQRFLVTNMSLAPQTIYDHIYVLRGDIENRIKELKHEIKADRLSCHRFLANQFRLLLYTAAYCLLWLLRQHLHGTELASAQMGTLRLKLLKIGGRVRQTTRRIWFHLASSYPCQALFEHVHTTLTIDSS
jgi:IS4 transposase